MAPLCHGAGHGVHFFRLAARGSRHRGETALETEKRGGYKEQTDKATDKQRQIIHTLTQCKFTGYIQTHVYICAIN